MTASDTHGNISDYTEEVCAEITASTVTACRVDEIIGYGGASELIPGIRHPRPFRTGSLLGLERKPL
jgi:hypothetical protein